MGVGRLAPHRVRAKYARALAEIPLPVRSFDGIDPSALTIIAEKTIASRTVQFGLLSGSPRLWLVFTEEYPQVLGYLTGLENTALTNGRPELHVTEPDHIGWARQSGHARQLKTAGLSAWRAAQRECEG